MANSPQSKKRARQAVKRRAHTASLRSMVRTYIKRVQAAVDANDQEKAAGALQDAVPLIDKAVSKGIMPKNTAARHKSRLNKKVKALGA